MDEPSYDLRLQAPFTMQVTGGTSSGKSFWTRRLLENAQVMMHPPPDRIIYAYGEWQEMFTEMKDVEFVRGVTESLVSRENLHGHTCLVIDDLSDEVDEKLIGALFTKLSHHRQISVIFLLNNLFYRGLKTMRDVSLNTHYLVVFRSARDHGSIATIGRQMFGAGYKKLLAAYEDATSEKYGYLMIDSKAATPNEIRLRTKIFPGETTICYVFQHGKK